MNPNRSEDAGPPSGREHDWKVRSPDVVNTSFGFVVGRLISARQLKASLDCSPMAVCLELVIDGRHQPDPSERWSG